MRRTKTNKILLLLAKLPKIFRILLYFGINGKKAKQSITKVSTDGNFLKATNVGPSRGALRCRDHSHTGLDAFGPTFFLMSDSRGGGYPRYLIFGLNFSSPIFGLQKHLDPYFPPIYQIPATPLGCVPAGTPSPWSLKRSLFRSQLPPQSPPPPPPVCSGLPPWSLHVRAGRIRSQ